MKNSKKGKRNGTISALIERHYHAGTRLVVALVLALTVASVVAAQAPILHIYLPVILKTFSGGQVSDASGSGAAPAAQQPPLDCGNLPPDAGHGEKIKCKSKDLIDETCRTVQLMSQDDLGILTRAQQDEYSSTCTFATEMVEATDPAEFQTFGMKRSAEGVAEYVGPDDPNQGYEDDGDSDGVCLLKKGGPNQQNCNNPDGCKPKKYEEWCAEVITDGIGDDDGFCEWQGKKDNSYLEPCVPLSDVAAIDSQEENFNEEKLVAVEKALDANIDAMKAVNIQLAADLEELRTLRATSAETFREYKPKECLGLMQVPIFPQDRKDYWILYGFLVAMDSMAAGHDTCDAAANQDVLGNNGSAVCVATAVLKGIAVGVFDNLELIDDTITATRLDNAVQCLEYVGDKIGDIANGVNEANGKIDHVVEHRRVHLQVVELKEKREFLVSATEAGKPSQPPHEIVASCAVRVSEKQPLSFVDVSATCTPQGNGLYLVVVDLPQSLKNAELFVFEVGHTETYEVEIDSEKQPRQVVHSGFTLFDRSAQNNVGLGQ